MVTQRCRRGDANRRDFHSRVFNLVIENHVGREEKPACSRFSQVRFARLLLDTIHRGAGGHRRVIVVVLLAVPRARHLLRAGSAGEKCSEFFLRGANVSV